MTLDLTSAARPGHQETGPRIAPGRPSLVAASFLRHQPCDHGSPDGRHVSPSPVPTTPAPVASAQVPFLWLCGPTGVGKSSVGYAIFQQVYRSGIKVAYVDLDQVGLCYPAGPG